MADLPDLDTTDISIASFFNVLHAGAQQLDPADVLNYSKLKSYSVYDNGIEGTLSSPRYNGADDREIGFRTKTDGWIVTWLDRERNHGDGITNPKGIIDLAPEWTTVRGNNTMPQTRLTNSIQGVVEELSNTDKITFTHGDCGHYSYEYRSAVGIAFISEHNPSDMTFHYPDSTTLLGIEHGAAGGQYAEEVRFGDTNILSQQGVGVDSNLAPDPNTVYTVSEYSGSSSTSLTNVVVWAE